MKTYRKSKHKEHAFVDKLNDKNISIFCGELNPDEIPKSAVKKPKKLEEGPKKNRRKSAQVQRRQSISVSKLS